MKLYNGSQDWDVAQEELAAAGLTDGLPVVPPTAARVQRMLAMHGYQADALVVDQPLLFDEVTWQAAAINAVMAGCKPEYLPVIGAAIEALVADEFNLLGIGTTTGSAAPVFIVNGPIVAKLGLNSAANAMGPGNRANATIGRALSLILRNVGGAIPGEGDMSTLGQPAKYTCCFAENESDSPWAPFHTERGFAASDSVVTVFGASGIIEMVDSSSNTAAGVAVTYAHSMRIAGTCSTGNHMGGGQPLVVVPPEIANIFQNDGYDKARVKQAIFELAHMPLSDLAPAVMERIRDARLREGGLAADAPMTLAQIPEDILIVVAGGVGIKAAYLPAWSSTRAVSRLIRC